MGRFLWVVAVVAACAGEADTNHGDTGPERDADAAAPDSDAALVEVTEVADGLDTAGSDGADLDVVDTNDTVPAELDDGGVPVDTVEVDGVEVEEDTASPPVLTGWTWQPLPELPRILQEHATVAIGGEIALIGGFENLALVDAVVVYDPVGRVFREGTPLPRALHHVNAAVLDGELMVLGALEGFAFTARGDTLVLEGDAWRARSSMPVGRQRGSAGVAVIGSDVYLVGGFRAGAVDDVDVYRGAEDRWERLADLPGARDHGGAVAVAGLVYAVGGRQGGIGSVEADLWRFDPANPEAGWVALSPMPTARGGFALGVSGDRIIVVGGEGNPSEPSGVFPQAELYDPADGRWYRLPDMPAPRHGMQAVAVNGVLYVPGGADVEAFGATRTFQALVPP